MIASFLIGVLLAILSCGFIGTSFLLKKVGLIRLSQRGLRAGKGNKIVFAKNVNTKLSICVRWLWIPARLGVVDGSHLL